MAEGDDIWSELAKRGLLAETPIALGGGNLDRRPEQFRRSFRARLADGRMAKLTLAREQDDYAARLAGLARAVPAAAPALYFHERVDGCDVIAEEFIDGVTLQSLLEDPATDFAALAANLDALLRSFASGARASEESAREAEWGAWTTSVLALPCWNEPDRGYLEHRVFPRVRASLFAQPARTQWIHGDLIAGNVVVDATGRFRLIDAEYAACTHFVDTEAVRFFALSRGAERLIPLLPPNRRSNPPAAMAHFWLEQIRREVVHNRADYVARWLPERLERVRKSLAGMDAEAVAGWPWKTTTPGGGVSSDEVDSHVEFARWLIDADHALEIRGWCCARGAHAVEQVTASVGTTTLARARLIARPDVQEHFPTRASALLSGFLLALPPVESGATVELAAILASGRRSVFWRANADDLPGHGPLLCGYSSWASLLDPDPPETPPDPSNPVPAQAACNATAGEPTAAGPQFSLLLPVYNTAPDHLRACLASIRRQSHRDWELVVVDDASGRSEIRPLLSEFAAADPRIHVHVRSANGGIAQATNDALAKATGKFVAFVDHDDVIRPHALATFAARLRRQPELDAIYSDEDKLAPDGQRIRPMFKPAFSPEFLRGVMYVGHFLAVRRTIALEVGGFDSTFDGVQDYEFMLRISERTQRIAHEARVLYHWRQSGGSSALVGNVKGDMDARQLAAVQAHLRRMGDPRIAEALGGHRVRISAWTEGDPATANREPQAAREVGTTTRHNDQARSATVMVRWGDGEEPLGRLARAAQETTADVLVLAHESITDLSAQAMAEIAALAQRPDAGCVAPVLIASDGLVAESGCTISGGTLIPMMSGFDQGGDGYNGSLRCNREVDAVSPSCVAIRRSLAVVHTAGAPSWPEFLRRCRQSGCFHRVCAKARVRLSDAFHSTAAASSRRPATESRGMDAGGPAATSSEFYNPHFRSEPADYRLGRRPKHLERCREPVVFRLESSIEEAAHDGWLELRGWCFHLEGFPIRLHLHCGDLDWSIAVDAPRADVASVYPLFTTGACGFSQRIALPLGPLELVLEAETRHERQVVFQSRIRIPRAVYWRRWRAHPARRLAFQLSASPAHGARVLEPERFPNSHAPLKGTRFVIVTPSYQQARFLREALRSVLDQGVICTYVVRDGGSIDGSVSLIEAESKRLHSWSSAPDAGQADAIVQGFAEVDGQRDDVMAWLNSDDFYLNGALQYAASYFARHPEVDVIYGHRVLVDECSREIGRWFLPPHDADVLRLNDFVPQETMFWRRRIWDKVGGIDPAFKFAMDWDLLLRFQAAGANIVRVPYFLACFRIHSAQKTSAQMASVGQKEIDALRVRTFGRALTPAEIENDPKLIRYLRKSAWIEMLWRTFGIRAR